MRKRKVNSVKLTLQNLKNRKRATRQQKKKTERTKAEDLIRKGKAKYIVWTSALLTSDLPFEKFGLVIVDEEHRFGVCQRNALFNEETHVVTMSATPIPRSIALTLSLIHI